MTGEARVGGELRLLIVCSVFFVYMCVGGREGGLKSSVPVAIHVDITDPHTHT